MGCFERSAQRRRVDTYELPTIISGHSLVDIGSIYHLTAFDTLRRTFPDRSWSCTRLCCPDRRREMNSCPILEEDLDSTRRVSLMFEIAVMVIKW